MRKHKQNGFTLVELLVVISIIALLVAIVLPAISNALFRGRLTATAANGRSIQQSVFVQVTEDIYVTEGAPWPISDQCAEDDDDTYDSSSHYLNMLVTNGTMKVGYNFFTAPGVKAAPVQEDFVSLDGKYNAWSLTACLNDGSVETLPFIMTKNFQLPKIDESAYGTSDDGIPDLLGGDTGKSKPFGDKGFVFVTKGGSAYALFKNDLQVGDQTTPGAFRTLFNIYAKSDGSTLDETLDVLTPKGLGAY